jgi:hypothetical protein
MEFFDNQITEIPDIDEQDLERYGKFLRYDDGSVNLDDIASDIDNLLNNYLDVDASTVEQGNAVSSEGDLPWLSPNTMQILDNFMRELNENPPPTDLMNIVPIRSNLIENEMASMDFSTQTSPIVEQSGGWGC